jgi:ribose-phosphate pyrophosphokinase
MSRAFDALVTIEPHLHRHQALDELYAIPARALSSADAVAPWVRRHVVRPAIVGPDEESSVATRALAERLRCPSVVLRKVRHGDRRVAIELPELAPLAGRTPVLVDDIVSTGHTLAQAVRALRRAGCAAPVCVGVHAVLDAAPARLLSRAGAARYVTCNTLEAATNDIDVTPLIATALLDLPRVLRAHAEQHPGERARSRDVAAS